MPPSVCLPSFRASNISRSRRRADLRVAATPATVSTSRRRRAPREPRNSPRTRARKHTARTVPCSMHEPAPAVHVVAIHHVCRLGATSGRGIGASTQRSGGIPAERSGRLSAGAERAPGRCRLALWSRRRARSPNVTLKPRPAASSPFSLPRRWLWEHTFATVHESNPGRLRT